MFCRCTCLLFSLPRNNFGCSEFRSRLWVSVRKEAIILSPKDRFPYPTTTNKKKLCALASTRRRTKGVRCTQMSATTKRGEQGARIPSPHLASAGNSPRRTCPPASATWLCIWLSTSRKVVLICILRLATHLTCFLVACSPFSLIRGICFSHFDEKHVITCNDRAPCLS